MRLASRTSLALAVVTALALGAATLVRYPDQQEAHDPSAVRRVAAAQAETAQGETAQGESMEQAAFDLDTLRSRLADTKGPWLEFLRVPELRTGLYSLPAGSVDRQQPHSEGEVYYVISGRATLSAGGEEHAAQPGAVLYVAAGVEHRFHSIEEDLEVLVFFARE